MEFLLQRIRGMRMQDGDEGAEVEKPKVLEEVSLEGIVKHIQQMERKYQLIHCTSIPYIQHVIL